IFPDISAFLEGRYQPRDNVERLALLGVCRFKNLNLALVKLHVDAFASDPKLADDPHVNHRYNAACASALAGSGTGQDAGGLSEAERARWLKQARDWLRADLAACGKKLDSGAAADHALVWKTLTHWQVNPDLAGLREVGAIDKLPADERNECIALWQEVENLLQRAKAVN